RVVGHHAADGGAAGCGDIGGESQTERSELRIQLVQHDSGFDARPALLRVHFENAVVVFRRINLNAVTDGLPALRCAASAHRQGTAMPAADLKRAQDILAIFGHDYTQGLDLIDAGVGGVERAGDLVEAHFPFDAAFEVATHGFGIDLPFELHQHSLRITGR